VEDELRALVQERLGAEARTVVRIDHGWDSIAFEVDDEWIVRVPRRSEVRADLRKEAALLPLLGSALPVPVPEVAVLEDTLSTFVIVHRKLRGKPLSSASEPALADEVGGFLAALHEISDVAEAGLPELTTRDWLDEQAAFAKRCETVLRLLDSNEARRAESMFESYLSRPPGFNPVLVHGDLGPEHILCRDLTVTGVIDWSDARVGDPALDFAWLLHGPDEAFSEALLGAYVAAGGRVDSTFRERALYFHRLGPLHGVLFGLRTGRPELVESGLAGVRAGLP
jgi:aminoglycoside phosphotransferase (APT) family kinase protein